MEVVQRPKTARNSLGVGDRWDPPPLGVFLVCGAPVGRAGTLVKFKQCFSRLTPARW